MSMESGRTNVQKRPKKRSFLRVMKTLSPSTYLRKAHEIYVRSLNKCAARVSSASTLPKSFTTTSARRHDEFGELVRAASQRRTSISSNLGFQRSMASAERALARSRTAATSICTIYEDEPCNFPASLPKTYSAASSRYPRSHLSSTPYNFNP